MEREVIRAEKKAKNELFFAGRTMRRSRRRDQQAQMLLPFGEVNPARTGEVNPERGVRPKSRSRKRKPEMADGDRENEPSQSDTSELLDEKGVAVMLQVSVGLVRKWRYSGQGPPWFKLSRSVRYRRATVQEWVTRQELAQGVTVWPELLAGVFPNPRDPCKPDKSEPESNDRRASRRRRH